MFSSSDIVDALKENNVELGFTAQRNGLIEYGWLVGWREGDSAPS